MAHSLYKLLTDVRNASETCSDLAGFVAIVDKFTVDAFCVLLQGGGNELYAKALLLKISNLLVSNFQYRQRHASLVSFPYGLIVDPSNGCPLHCPGCLHNRVFQSKIHPDWPSGLLSMEIYKKFLEQYGPYASIILFFNWGEPLLNKQTPEFVAMAKAYMLRTSISSNLSVEFDADALVLSGLDHMTLSLDGATPETYGKYRQGGNFDLVIDNIRKLVSAKRKHGIATPILSWQYLLFEHNKHEVDMAKRMVSELGVDEIRFVHPYGIPWDKSILPANEVPAQVYRVFDKPELIARQEERTITNLSEDFNEIFSVKWTERLREFNSFDFSEKYGKTCKWLYGTICMDALGRILPCCQAPRKKTGLNYIFSGKEECSQNDFNSESYLYSRRHFVESSDINREGGEVFQFSSDQNAPYCVTCQDKFGEPLIHNDHLMMYYKRVGKFGGLDAQSVKKIVDWG